jgi:hypothetical protein
MANLVPFVAFTPGENHRNPIDFIDTNNSKFYKTMTKPSDIKFDGKSENVRAFMERVTEHAVGYSGMINLFNIPDPIRMGVVRDFATSYGTIPMDDCRLCMQRVYTTGQQDAQDDSMLFSHLAGSLTESFEKEIKTQPSLYTISVARGNYQSGILFLKLVLSKAQTDAVATVTLLRKKVANLAEKMSEL